VIDLSVSRDYVTARFPTIKVLPIIVGNNNQLIGSWPELINYLNPELS
jgi:hypothetical protein